MILRPSPTRHSVPITQVRPPPPPAGFCAAPREFYRTNLGMIAQLGERESEDTQFLRSGVRSALVPLLFLFGDDDGARLFWKLTGERIGVAVAGSAG